MTATRPSTPSAIRHDHDIDNHAVFSSSPVTRHKVTDIFSKDEIRMLTSRSDVMGASAIGFTWLVIVLALCSMAWASQQPWWLAVPVFIAGFVILAGRHLALAILHHEAAHRTLFRNRWCNDVLADWLCARPIWNDVSKYRTHHFLHHTRTGTPADPDLSLVAPFPVARRSLLRKFLRDLSGLTGLKYLFGRVLMDAGCIKWTVANDVIWLPREGKRWWHYPRDLMKNSAGMLITNSLLFLACWAAGYPWLYAVWVLSYLTPFPLFLRIRSMAEHACTEATTDMFLNTRTTRAGWLARATVAPIRVNFHIEHHVMASVPYFRLATMHRLLRERGMAPPPPGYLDVLRIVGTAKS